MRESETGSVEYADMEPDDFSRYVEYAYRYDYTVPSCGLDDRVTKEEVLEEEARLAEERLETARLEEAIPETPVLFSSKSQKRKAKMLSASITPRTNFVRRNSVTRNEPKASMLDNFEPQGNNSPEQDFTLVFLAHARLYTFAYMRLIDPLKRLALHKLHKTLLGFQLYKRRIGDVIELARYAYGTGEDRKEDGTIEDLRKLVMEYMACAVSTFGKHDDFVSLLEEGGEFVGDFWRTVVKEGLL
ncbi:hypothetical protein BDW02DRAFT_564687 [Decorospora gaudefroyi]|uniref:Uncharacterized protein n=1 Tax=Decorospora gaudefroyi TaxID=184978 RepID=A0A6A5KV40_9PLEO|nr:hypothetical protein BDW02DRAFT_564687 [Decorospora gaudefroyi]